MRGKVVARGRQKRADYVLFRPSAPPGHFSRKIGYVGSGDIGGFGRDHGLYCLSAQGGGRLYLGPTLRAGFWRFLREGPDFPEENSWGQNSWGVDYERVSIGNA